MKILFMLFYAATVLVAAWTLYDMLPDNFKKLASFLNNVDDKDNP